MVRLTPSRLLFVAVTIALLFVFFTTSSFGLGARGYDVLADLPDGTASTGTGGTSSLKITLGETCSPFSSGGMDGVTIVIKFGAPEVATKLASYLKALSRCEADLLLFSDRKDSIDGIEIVDTLANLRSELKHQNPDFEIYDKIQRSNNTHEKTPEGWKLDKYKFLPMMELAAYSRPDSNWFVFIELDTYVNWDNLYRFLDRFDPMQSHYFGSPVWPKNKPTFAHGGSGFVLSHGALNKLVARGRTFTQNNNSPGTHLFGKNLQEECCGDELLAKVLKEVGVKFRGYWPMFNGEKSSSVPFGREHWCEAIITLHHLGEEDFEMMRQFEARRLLPQTSLTFKELFEYVEPLLTRQVDDWSNMSEDVTLGKGSAAGLSFAACFDACLEDKMCVQCEHFGDTCRLSHSIRLGHKASRDGDTRWTSGWVKDRVEAFRAARPECGGAHAVHPNP